MERQQQVCGLEPAKKLKELGVRQESLFYWAKDHSEKEFWISRGTPSGLFYDKTWMGYHDLNGFPKKGKDKNKPAPIFSAFTVAELGDLLKQAARGDFLRAYCEVMDLTMEQIQGSEIALVAHNLMTQPDIAADMLIYLIENKLITV